MPCSQARSFLFPELLAEFLALGPFLCSWLLWQQWGSQEAAESHVHGAGREQCSCPPHSQATNQTKKPRLTCVAELLSVSKCHQLEAKFPGAFHIWSFVHGFENLGLCSRIAIKELSCISVTSAVIQCPQRSHLPSKGPAFLVFHVLCTNAISDFLLLPLFQMLSKQIGSVWWISHQVASV